MIQFDRDTHTYTDEGVRVPSVTQILAWLYPSKYAGIPEEVLNDAAEYGNRIHEWVEHFVMTGRKKRQTDYMRLSTYQAVEMINARDIQIESVEKIVSGKGYAGTYDMYGSVEGKSAVIDIKTTAKLDEEYLAWQLGMYSKALRESGLPVEEHYCLWLPKSALAQFVRILPKTDEEIDWLVFRYEQEHHTD